jgi:cell division protein FtsI/penicillin-binding protein 2
MAFRTLSKPEAFSSLSGGRIIVLALIIFLFSLIIIARLFSLQVIQNSFYLALASEKHEVYKDLFPERGSVYTREKDELYPLVVNRDYYLVYAEPIKISNPGKIVDAVASILNLEEEEWKDLLTRLAKNDDPYEPIKHKVTKQQVEQIEALELEGVGFLPESYRFYPEKGIGGHIFGFVSVQDEDKVGQYGLEGYFNKDLSGRSGLIRSIKDALGSLVTIGPRSVQRAEDGVDLVLTIDRHVQFTACQKLKEFYDYFEAETGTVIIMEPTGAIIAMCSFPDFDPENYNEVEDINYLNNPAIFYPFEPGSVFKTITMAGGLDTGKVDPNTTYIDEGEVKVGPYTIKNADFEAHGEQTMTQVLEQSLNTGAIFVEQEIGKEVFKRYIKDFGFGKNSGITLDTEMAGDLSSLDKRGDIWGITASYGQGITVTPLQLINAFAAVANRGELMKPYIVAEIIEPDGETEMTKPQKVRQVIEPKTASLLTGMLTSVVENGYGEKAGVEGYYIGGKTGTAQVAAKGGYGAKTIHTFVGFGPVANPKFVMLVKLDNPQGIRFASDSVAPLFGQLAEFLLNYYQIPPDY